MRVLKQGKTVYGMQWTAAEKKALTIEVRKESAVIHKKFSNEMAAMVLWYMHQKYGFGEKRLRDFYDEFLMSVDQLVARYELEDEDDIWLCTQKLKDAGIDLEQWDKENAAKRNKEEV